MTEKQINYKYKRLVEKEDCVLLRQEIGINFFQNFLILEEIIEELNSLSTKQTYLFIQEQVLKKVFQFPNQFNYIEMPKELMIELTFDFENYNVPNLINYLGKFGYKL